MSLLKKMIKSPWVRNIVIGFLFLSPAVRDLFVGLPFWSTFKLIVVSTWKALVFFFTIKVSMWMIFAFIILLIGILFLIDFFQNKKRNQIDYLNYTKDFIKGWNWSWHWVKVLGKFQINDLAPHCPKCETKLKYIQFSFSQPYVRCPRCPYRSSIEGKEDIERIILDNIERGLIKQSNY